MVSFFTHRCPMPPSLHRVNIMNDDQPDHNDDDDAYDDHDHDDTENHD